MTYPLVPLRRFARMYYGDALGTDERGEGLVPVMGSNGPFDKHHTPNLGGPCIVVGRKGSHGKITWCDTSAWVTDTAFGIDDRQTETHLRWLYYALQAARLDQTSLDTGVPGLSRDFAYEQRIPLAPIHEQRAIAAYLDTETARIDALIAKKRKLRELAQERWEQFVRSTLLNLDAPVLPLKRRWQVLDCKHRTPTYTDSGYPVVSPGDATPGRLDLNRCSRFVGEDDFRDLTSDGRQPVRGTIIYSRNASIGIACYIDTDADLTMGQDVCLIKSPDQNQLYLTYALNTLGVDQLEEQKIGSTFSRVNVAQIVELKVPVPPPEVQERIAGQFEEEWVRVDQLTSALQTQIVLLRERRQALITAAVTGELEVPGVAA